MLLKKSQRSQSFPESMSLIQALIWIVGSWNKPGQAFFLLSSPLKLSSFVPYFFQMLLFFLLPLFFLMLWRTTFLTPSRSLKIASSSDNISFPISYRTDTISIISIHHSLILVITANREQKYTAQWIVGVVTERNSFKTWFSFSLT